MTLLQVWGFGTDQPDRRARTVCPTVQSAAPWDLPQMHVGRCHGTIKRQRGPTGAEPTGRG
jgi:hypothetical protein